MAKSRDDIIAAAGGVFVRHGFKRTTMADIAEAAEMSRPALYLVFPSKEEAFVAVMDLHFARALAEIRAALPKLATAQEKLVFALDVWLVRSFQAVKSSANASDLYESSFQFAREIVLGHRAELVKVLADVLDPLVKRARAKVSARDLAQTLFNAGVGVKQAASDVAGLRAQLAQLASVFLASVGEGSLQKAAARR